MIPTLTKSSGFVSGSSITSRSSLICSLKPPISLKLTPPSSSPDCIWKTVGSTSLGNTRMIVKVVISKATLVPGLSLSKFNLVRQPTTYRGPLLALTMNRSASSRFKTSPMICPTDCNADKSSSVFWYRSTNPRTSSRIRFNFASTSRCSRILERYCSRICSRSLAIEGSAADMMSALRMTLFTTTDLS